MNEKLLTDQLSWDKFFHESTNRKNYPPKNINLFNRLVAHTNNFFIVAAIGAFSPGYLMLVSKKLIPSVSMVEDKHIDEIKWLLIVISNAIRKTYSSEVAIIEHGNCACIGGLDRAHVHIMAISKKADDDIIKRCINKTLINRKIGIDSVEINGNKLENIHDIVEIMNSPQSNSYKVNGKQLLYEDLHSDLDINDWPIVTRNHVKKKGHYVYFKTKSPTTSFLTNRNFQTQLGRQIVFEIEKATNSKLRDMNNNIVKKNTFARVWRWQEYAFEENMLKTMKDLIPALLDIKNDKFNFLTFKNK